MSAKFVRRSSATKGSSSSAVVMHALEDRKLFAGITADKVVDLSGPAHEMVEAGGQIYVSAPLASGGAIQRLYSTNGNPNDTKLLLDLSQPGMVISSIDQLTATEDGRIFFTASATGGRHVFELNPANGKVHQITSGTNKMFANLEAAGTRLYFHEGNSDTIYTVAPGEIAPTEVKQIDVVSDFQAAGPIVFFIGPNESLYRTDGTADGTFKVSGDYRVTRGDYFTSNELVIFEGDKDDENTSLFIVGLGGTQPQKVADDFTLFNADHAEIGGWVYFSGGYYNTSPLGEGRQLYRVNAAGTIELAAKIPGSNGAGSMEGIGAVGNYIYFTAGDGEFLPSQGTSDRELYKLNTLNGDVKLVTDQNVQYPIEIGDGVLSSYYFVAAPDKENARFGTRQLYRTNPVTDEIEHVLGLPVVKDLSGNDYTRIREIAVGANGLFFTADSSDNGRERDVFFSQSPFSRLDPQSMIVTITGTDFADYTTMRVENGELILTQNGFEERHDLSLVGRIEAFLKQGNDIFVSDATVLIPTYAIGDEGDDRMVGGAGNDTLTGGAGRNVIWGGEGNDRLNGAGGRDVLVGEGGDDSIMAQGGNDVLLGGHGSDWVVGGLGDDQIFGSLGADRLYGEDGNDTIYGQLSADLIVGGNGDDVLDGAAGIDAIDGGAGIDTLIGGDDDDHLYANDGELDFVYGGAGNDTATADASEGLFDLVETIL